MSLIQILNDGQLIGLFEFNDDALTFTEAQSELCTAYGDIQHQEFYGDNDLIADEINRRVSGNIELVNTYEIHLDKQV